MGIADGQPKLLKRDDALEAIGSRTQQLSKRELHACPRALANGEPVRHVHRAAAGIVTSRNTPRHIASSRRHRVTHRMNNRRTSDGIYTAIGRGSSPLSSTEKPQVRPHF